MTDAGLASLPALPRLRRVYLWQTAVTPGGLERLRAAAPKLEIVLGDVDVDGLRGGVDSTAQEEVASNDGASVDIGFEAASNDPSVPPPLPMPARAGGTWGRAAG